MGTLCRGGKNRKYAANSKLAEHTGIPQRPYLRFLCAKRAVCSGVPEFAAHFRQTIPEVREKPKSTNQTPVLHFRDLRFCWHKSGCARSFPNFPRTSGKRGNIERPEAKAATNSTEKQPLKRKNRLSAVPAGQAGRNVARPHHGWHFKEKPDLSQSLSRWNDNGRVK